MSSSHAADAATRAQDGNANATTQAHQDEGRLWEQLNTRMMQSALPPLNHMSAAGRTLTDSDITVAFGATGARQLRQTIELLLDKVDR